MIKFSAQRTGLCAGLDTGNVRPVQMPIYILRLKVKTKSQIEKRLPEQKLISEQKVQVYFRPPALRQTPCWH